MNKGKFIVFEGIDGSGKGSAVNAVAKRFPNCVTTREPGGTKLAESMRSILLSPIGGTLPAAQQMDMFFATRRIHLLDKVYPELQKGALVVSDRFDASTFVYQKVLKSFTEKRNNFDTALRKKFFDLRKQVVTRLPDAYIFLDVDPKEGMRRRAQDKNQESNHFDLAGIAEQERRRKAYLLFLAKVESKSTRCITVNANELKHIVAQNVLKEVEAIIG